MCLNTIHRLFKNFVLETYHLSNLQNKWVELKQHFSISIKHTRCIAFILRSQVNESEKQYTEHGNKNNKNYSYT